MIHTVYSNSYEVLRVCLMNNIEALGVSTGGSGGASLFERAFEKVPVITPNNAVEEDLRRAVADRDGICAGIDFMKLSSWMGFFSKEPMANIVGNEADWMLWYPVLVNASLLSVFGASLFSGMPVVERLARLGLRGKPLPPEGVAYTRRVTAVWCGFFVVNGSIAVATILADDLTLWALWNGGLSYVAIGCLMVGEYLYRKLVKHV